MQVTVFYTDIYVAEKCPLGEGLLYTQKWHSLYLEKPKQQFGALVPEM